MTLDRPGLMAGDWAWDQVMRRWVLVVARPSRDYLLVEWCPGPGRHLVREVVSEVRLARSRFDWLAGAATVLGGAGLGACLSEFLRWLL